MAFFGRKIRKKFTFTVMSVAPRVASTVGVPGIRVKPVLLISNVYSERRHQLIHRVPHLDCLLVKACNYVHAAALLPSMLAAATLFLAASAADAGFGEVMGPEAALPVPDKLLACLLHGQLPNMRAWWCCLSWHLGLL